MVDKNAGNAKPTGEGQGDEIYTAMNDLLLVGKIRAASQLHDAVRLTGDDARFISGIVERQMDGGANPHLTDSNGDLPLHIAARRGLSDVVDLFLARDVDKNTMNNKGKTAADAARDAGFEDLAKRIEAYAPATNPPGALMKAFAVGPSSPLRGAPATTGVTGTQGQPVKVTGKGTGEDLGK